MIVCFAKFNSTHFAKHLVLDRRRVDRLFLLYSFAHAPRGIGVASVLVWRKRVETYQGGVARSPWRRGQLLHAGLFLFWQILLRREGNTPTARYFLNWKCSFKAKEVYKYQFLQGIGIYTLYILVSWPYQSILGLLKPCLKTAAAGRWWAKKRRKWRGLFPF
jgi:hypothetical protein